MGCRKRIWVCFFDVHSRQPMGHHTVTYAKKTCPYSGVWGKGGGARHIGASLCAQCRSLQLMASTWRPRGCRLTEHAPYSHRQEKKKRACPPRPPPRGCHLQRVHRGEENYTARSKQSRKLKPTQHTQYRSSQGHKESQKQAQKEISSQSQQEPKTNSGRSS